jgi:hypothetical protein
VRPGAAARAAAVAVAAAVALTAGACKVYVPRARVSVQVRVACTEVTYAELPIIQYELLDATEAELASRSEPFLGMGLSSVDLDTEPHKDVFLRVTLRYANGAPGMVGTSTRFDLERGPPVDVPVTLTCANGSSAVAELLPGRTYHVPAAFPDGRVLVVGGLEGFDLSTSPYSESVLYDPGTGTLAPFAPELGPRALAAVAALPGGGILVAGGIAGPGMGVLSDLWLVRPDGSTVLLGSVPTGVIGLGAAPLASGAVLLAAGGAAYRIRVDEDAGTLLENTTLPGAPAGINDMHFARVGTTGERWLWAGGGAGLGAVIPGSAQAGLFDVSAFIPLVPTGGAVAPMAYARILHGVLAIPGTDDVLVFGGATASSGGMLAPPEVYRAALGGFVPVSSGPTLDPRAYGYGSAVVTTDDGRILLVSGAFAPPDTSWFEPADDPATAAIYEVGFSEGPKLFEPRFVHTVTRLPGGSFLVVGGLDPSDPGRLVTSVEVLTP